MTPRGRKKLNVLFTALWMCCLESRGMAGPHCVAPSLYTETQSNTAGYTWSNGAQHCTV